MKPVIDSSEELLCLLTASHHLASKYVWEPVHVAGLRKFAEKL